MIDLCKIFGVEEGEEFKFRWSNKEKYINDIKYKIEDNCLLWYDNKLFKESGIDINEINDIVEVIKLPKKKEFTDDELCILRNVDKEYKWIARDKDDYCICAYGFKPSKMSRSWVNGGESAFLDGFSHLFNSIQWEDEEPVFIDDYVERGAE